MGILLLIISSISIYFILTSCSKNKDVGYYTFFIAPVVLMLGTYNNCSDGWLSRSIGLRGACSHHGGVDTYLNVFGWAVLFISIIHIAIVIFAKNKRTKQ